MKNASARTRTTARGSLRANRASEAPGRLLQAPGSRRPLGTAGAGSIREGAGATATTRGSAMTGSATPPSRTAAQVAVAARRVGAVGAGGGDSTVTTRPACRRVALFLVSAVAEAA